MPFAVAANAVPIIAFAPIMNNWFGLLNPFSKMAIAAVLCFFPVMINTLRGLTSVDPRAIELMRSYAAGQVSIFRRVRIPASLPHMFAGLKIASVLSMIGAIVGEYFGGPTTALGVTILNASAYTNFIARVGRDRAGQRVRDPLLRRGRPRGAADHLVGPVAPGLPRRSESGSEWRGPDRVVEHERGTDEVAGSCSRRCSWCS